MPIVFNYPFIARKDIGLKFCHAKDSICGSASQKTLR